MRKWVCCAAISVEADLARKSHPRISPDQKTAYIKKQEKTQQQQQQSIANHKRSRQGYHIPPFCFDYLRLAVGASSRRIL